EKIDRDDGLRNEPSLLPYHVDCRFEAGNIQIVGFGVDIDENRLCLGQSHHFSRGGKGEARHEDRVSRPDAGSVERQEQRIRAIGAGNDMPDADIGGKLLLKLGHLGPEYITPVLDDAIDRRLQSVADSIALRAKDDELQDSIVSVFSRRWSPRYCT